LFLLFFYNNLRKIKIKIKIIIIIKIKNRRYDGVW